MKAANGEKRDAALHGHFHAPFLDGLRGFACLLVVWYHGDSMTCKIFKTCYADDPDMDDFGFIGVQLFFLLSAFLLTYLALIEWEKLTLVPQLAKLQQRQQQENNDVERARLLEQGADEGSVSPPNHDSYGSRLESWLNFCKPYIFVWCRYTIRRVFRIWPLFMLIYLFACFASKGDLFETKQSENGGENSPLIHGWATYWDGVTMHKVYQHYWTLPVETAYYVVIPFIVIIFVSLVQLVEWLLIPVSTSAPVRLAIHTVVRVLSLIPLVVYQVPQDEPMFVTGSLLALVFRELQRFDLVPLSHKEERAHVQERSLSEHASASPSPQPPPSSTSSSLSSSSVTLNSDGEDASRSNYCLGYNSEHHLSRVWLFPVPSSAHAAVRLFFNVASCVLFFFVFTGMPHYNHLIFGSYKRDQNDIGRTHIYSAALLCMLMSRDGLLLRFFETEFLRKMGAWSFSLYITSPYLQYHLPIYFGFEVDDSNTVARAMDSLDLFIITTVICVLLAWLLNVAIERPTIDAGSWLIKKFFTIDSGNKNKVAAT